MRSARFGPLPVDVPLVGQGTWNVELDRGRDIVAALEAGIAAGMTHIDTAELYGSGRVERMIAPALRSRRGELFLVSKVLPQNASYDGTLAACERSLQRLGTDYLDLYLLHWPGSVPLAETIRAFDKLKSTGKIRAFGVSNFDVDEFDEAVSIAGAGSIACNQVLYHLKERSIEHAVIPACRRHGVAVVAYSPFGSGDFPSPRSDGGKVLAEIANRHGASPYRIALAFLIRQGNVFAIPKASDPAHVADNAAAAGLDLTADDMHAIDAAFPVRRRRRLAVL